MTRRGLVCTVHTPAAIAAGALWTAAGCELQHLDAVTAPEPSAGQDASHETTRAEGSSDAGSEAPSASSSAACTSLLAPVLAWNFDTTDEGWMLTASTDAQATFSWTGAMGDPSPGALEIDVGDAGPDAAGLSVVWVYKEISAVSLSGGTVSAWVFLDRGPSPQFLSFVQTAPAEAWGDNGEIRLPVGVWTCVSISVSSPATAQGDYEPGQVIKVGFEMIGAPFRLLIDAVRAE